MVELVRTNEPVLISWLEAALAADGIGVVVLDTHASVVDGSVVAIQRRLMVAEADLGRARLVLAEAERLAGGGDVG